MLAGAQLNGLGRSARFAGFADALLSALAELESGLLEPDQLDGDLALLYAAYREELDRLALWDRDLLRRRAVERLRSELDAWDGRPVFAYGFEDLTGAEWGLLEALSGRADVTVSLPYEPGRAAFASLRRTQEDLASLAGGQIEELPARAAEYGHAALAHLERHLFADTPPAGPALDGAVRFFEGAGARGSLELTAEEIRELVAAGTPPEEIALVVPSVERWRASLETVLGTLGIPFAIEGRVRLGQTAVRPGAAGAAALRMAARRAPRSLRLPALAVLRLHALERRLPRGQAARPRHLHARHASRRRRSSSATGSRCRRWRRSAPPTGPVAAVRATAAAMAAGSPRPRGAAGGRREPRRPARLRRDRAPARRARRLAGPRRRALGGRSARGARARRGAHRLGRASQAASRSSSCTRARTRRFDAVFLLGLEEGTLPRRGNASPFLDDDVRGELDRHSRARLVRPDPVERERYLFYTACTRATRRLTLVREAATDEGSPREPSPFWDEVVALFDPEDVRRWTRRRPLSQLTWQLEAAPTERERLRALALLSLAEPAGRRGAWPRRTAGSGSSPARGAPSRGRRSSKHPRVLAELSAKTPFNVTELERFADCSSAWFFERLISPRTIDRKVDAMLRGSVAHTTLHRFYAGLPRALGSDRVDESRLEDALAFLGECLEGALGGVKMEMTELERRELEQSLRRDLEQLVRDEARSPLPLVPRKFEVGFGSERSAPELQRGLDLGDGVTLSGKIDRIDVDPGSARGIVQDYKSGRTGTRRPRSRRSCGCRSRSTCSSCATSSGSSRSAASTGRSPASGAPAACCAPRRRTTSCPGSSRTTTSRRTRSGRRSRARATSRAASRSGSARATCATTRRGRTAARPGATSGGCAGSGAAVRTPERAAGGGDRGARAEVFVSAGAGTGKTTVLVERFAEAVCERGLDVDSLLVITYTERAAGELRGRIRARLREAGRHDLARVARRRLDLDDPRLLPPAAEGAPVRRRPRPALPRPRRQPGPRHPRRGVRGGAEPVLRRRRSRAAPAARDLRRRRPAPDADDRLRDAALGRARARARAGRAARPRGAPGGARRGGARPRRGLRRRRTPLGQRPRRRSRSTAAAAAAGAPARSQRPARAHRARRELRGGAQGRASRLRSTRWRCTTASCCRSCCSASRTPTPRPRIASRRSTSRTCSCARATCSATTRRCASASSSASARSWSTSSRTRTGSSASSSTCSPGPTRSGSSSATSSSRSTASGTPTCRCSASAAPRPRRCCR